MADVPADLDIISDLNSQGADTQQYGGGDTVPEHRRPSEAPSVVPEAEADPAHATPSLRDTLTDAFKGTTAPPAVDPAKAPGDPSAPPQQPSGGPELVKVGERFHRKDGSFASTAEIEAFNAVAEGKPAPPVLAPWAQSMTAVEREQLTSLPAETRQWFERTMEGVNQQAAQYQEYGLIEQLINHRRPFWQQNGVTAPVALQQLFNLSDFANENPGDFILQFAANNRIDLDELIDQQEAKLRAANGGNVDPALQGLQKEIAELRNTIGGFTNVNVSQQHAQNMQHVNRFVQEKDEQGNPRYPYFNDVADGIAQHVAFIRSQQPYLSEPEILKAAYDFATYNNPAIREKMQQESLKATQDRAAAEAARARQAGVSINGGPAGDSSQAPNNANRSLREELVHAWHQNTLQ